MQRGTLVMSAVCYCRYCTALNSSTTCGVLLSTVAYRVTRTYMNKSVHMAGGRWGQRDASTSQRRTTAGAFSQL